MNVDVGYLYWYDGIVHEKLGNQYSVGKYICGDYMIQYIIGRGNICDNENHAAIQPCQGSLPANT